MSSWRTNRKFGLHGPVLWWVRISVWCARIEPEFRRKYLVQTRSHSEPVACGRCRRVYLGNFQSDTQSEKMQSVLWAQNTMKTNQQEYGAQKSAWKWTWPEAGMGCELWSKKYMSCVMEFFNAPKFESKIFRNDMIFQPLHCFLLHVSSKWRSQTMRTVPASAKNKILKTNKPRVWYFEVAFLSHGT